MILSSLTTRLLDRRQRPKDASPRGRMLRLLDEVRANLYHRSPGGPLLPRLHLVHMPRPTDMNLWRQEHQDEAWRAARAWAVQEHGEWILRYMDETLRPNTLSGYRSASVQSAWWTKTPDGGLPDYIDGTLFVCDLDFYATQPDDEVRQTLAHETYHTLTVLDRIREGKLEADVPPDIRTDNKRLEEGAADTFAMLIAPAAEQNAVLNRVIDEGLTVIDPFLRMDWRIRSASLDYPVALAEGVLRRLIAAHGQDLEALDTASLVRLNQTIWETLHEHGLVRAWCDAHAMLALHINFSGAYTRDAWERFFAEDTTAPEFIKQIVRRHLEHNTLPMPGPDVIETGSFDCGDNWSSLCGLADDAWTRAENAAFERAVALIAERRPGVAPDARRR